MARISGINIPSGKPVVVSLTYLYGIGLTKSKKICEILKIDENKKVNQLTEQEIAQIRSLIGTEEFQVEGDLRRTVSLHLKRLMDLGNYRGIRLRRGLPANGQRTKTNARTRKGKSRPIAGKK